MREKGNDMIVITKICFSLDSKGDDDIRKWWITLKNVKWRLRNQKFDKYIQMESFFCLKYKRKESCAEFGP